MHLNRNFLMGNMADETIKLTAETSPHESRNCNTTVRDLSAIITQPASGFLMLPCHAYDEVFPGIFVGEASIALEESELQKIGITHVLNAAYGKKLYHVNTGPDFYKSGIVFHGIPAMDVFTFKLNHYFDEASDFNAQAVGTMRKGKLDGKILVHCKEGVSRSVSLVLAYLVRDQEMNIKEAIRQVRSKREIAPNEGFLQQLINFASQFGRA